MTEFLREFGIYVLGGIVILFVIITYFLSRKPEKVEAPAKPESKPEVIVKQETFAVEKPTPIEVLEPKDEVKSDPVSPVTPTENVVESKPEPIVEKEVQPVETSKPLETPKPKALKKSSPKPVTEAESLPKSEPSSLIDEDADEEAALKRVVKNPKYHISMNKDEQSTYFKKWRVRKEGSTKTIKYFDTQKEAIEYAQALAEKANTSVVIHKVDGSIRKQDYTKK